MAKKPQQMGFFHYAIKYVLREVSWWPANDKMGILNKYINIGQDMY